MGPQEFEPIAIVGMGCRLPGKAATPSAYWRLLCGGADALTDVPPERWDVRRYYHPDPEVPGKSYVRRAGFLREPIDQFDPLVFGITPREAERLDPQQRLLLEVAWEAFEDAGLPFERLAGSRTGVFIGAFCLDYMLQSLSGHNREDVDAHVAMGTTMTLLSNRLSHTFDLRGPSSTVDTACSSSLVAVHHACWSLWCGESSIALAGGVNVMLRPEPFIMMSKGRFLSPEGRCATFDERASGYARGEGAGVIVLKPLSQAKRDRDPIHALIRMTGVNHGGRTPGVAMPSAEAQGALIREVYQRAGIEPARIRYVETHGTGTRVGDPVELGALHAVLSEGRAPDRPCWVGASKPNIGHLEAAAGIAGLIKAVLVLRHKQIPPNIHFERPNPEIAFDAICLRVPVRLEPLPTDGQPALAGVNSFGYGGTNAHVLLEAAPEHAEPSTWSSTTCPCMSCRGSGGSSPA